MTEEKKTDLIEVMADNQLMERGAFWNIIRKTVIPASGFSDEDVMVFLSIANHMNLNPMTGEVYAFKQGQRVVPMVGIDGWIRRANDHPAFDGMIITDNDENQSATVTIYRKDRSHPTVVTEYLSECRKQTGPWNSHPRRMLRHRAIIQAVRIAFGSGGAVDMDDKSAMEATYEDISDKTQGTVDRLTEAMTESRGADQVYDEDYADIAVEPPEDFVPCSMAGCGNEAEGVCAECNTPLCKDHVNSGLCKICSIG